jgi:GMP synthase-like glutamine amidotransferase
MDRTILIVKHKSDEGPGLIGKFFIEDGWALRTIELEDGEKLPDTLKDIACIIMLGGQMNVYEDEIYPFLKEEDNFIRKALINEIPMLGICLGAQLIARTCGASVTRAPEREMGWYQIKLTAEGRRDSIFRGLSNNFQVFQWHEDTFEIPVDGVLLAQSKKCKNQAFRIGNNVYGLQFHIEVTDDMIESWMEGSIWKNSVARAAADTGKMKEIYEQQMKQIFLNFKGLVESSMRVKRVMKLFVEDEKKTKKKKLLWWDTKEHAFTSAVN